MRIAYLTSQYARPSDTFIRDEVAALRELGHEVHTFSIRRPAEPAGEPEVAAERDRTDYVLDQGPAALARAVARRGPRELAAAARLAAALSAPGLRGRVWPAAYLAEGAYLAGRLEELRIEHLHDHIAEGSAAVAALASRMTGVPYSITMHGAGELARAAGLALDVKFAGATFVAAISEHMRTQVLRWARPADASKVHVIRCGVPARVLEHPARPAPSAPRLVAVGRLSPEKGHRVLVEALATLAASGADVHVTIVGDGPERDSIESRARELEVTELVALPGWLPRGRVMELLLDARALVMPSFAEGLPVTVMEALALRRPVVATSIGGIPELVRPGENGWLVPAGDPHALAEAIRAAVQAPAAELERMGEEGARRVAERHDVRREAGRLAELFERGAA